MSEENNKPAHDADKAKDPAVEPAQEAIKEADTPPAAEAAPTPAESPDKAAEAPAAAAEASEAGKGAEDAPKAPEAASDASGEAPAVDPEREAKLKAAAEARAARAKAREAAAEAGDAAPTGDTAAPAGDDADKEAKAKAAAEARAARARERAAKTGEGADPAVPKEPSPKQPLLDRAVQLIKEHVGEDAIEDASINERDGHRPTLIVKADKWLATAEFMRSNEAFDLHYLRNVSGVDMETHMEVVYNLINLKANQDYIVKVKADRELPVVPSVTPIWATANWNEREIYDLLGIDFPGHPDLRRIMMSDEWVGHPLRKDYEPLDPEV